MVDFIGLSPECDDTAMNWALALAQQAAKQGEVPVGALVVAEGKVIGQGFNQPITSHDPCAHAEIIALRDAATRLANYRLINSTLYVTLEPCTMCFGALIHARVARLVFAANEPKAGVIHSALALPEQGFYNHKLQISQGVLAAPCSQLLSEFFASRRAAKALARKDSLANTTSSPSKTPQSQ